MKLQTKEHDKKSRLVFLITGRRKAVLTDVGEMIKYGVRKGVFTKAPSVGSNNKIKSRSRRIDSNQMN